MAAKNTFFMAQPDSSRHVYMNTVLDPADCQSAVPTQLEVMSTRPYNPVRSVVILITAFLLPLLLTLYSDRLNNVYASFWSPSVNSAAAKSYSNATIQSDSILAQQQNVCPTSPKTDGLTPMLMLL